MNSQTKQLLWEAFKEGCQVDNCNSVDSKYYRDLFEKFLEEKLPHIIEPSGLGYIVAHNTPKSPTIEYGDWYKWVNNGQIAKVGRDCNDSDIALLNVHLFHGEIVKVKREDVDEKCVNCGTWASECGGVCSCMD